MGLPGCLNNPDRELHDRPMSIPFTRHLRLPSARAFSRDSVITTSTPDRSTAPLFSLFPPFHRRDPRVKTPFVRRGRFFDV